MQTETITKEELKAGLRTVQAILELATYNQILDILKNARLIEIKSDEIIWKQEVK